MNTELGNVFPHSIFLPKNVVSHFGQPLPFSLNLSQYFYGTDLQTMVFCSGYVSLSQSYHNISGVGIVGFQDSMVEGGEWFFVCLID